MSPPSLQPELSVAVSRDFGHMLRIHTAAKLVSLRPARIVGLDKAGAAIMRTIVPDVNSLPELFHENVPPTSQSGDPSKVTVPQTRFCGQNPASFVPRYISIAQLTAIVSRDTQTIEEIASPLSAIFWHLIADQIPTSAFETEFHPRLPFYGFERPKSLQ